MLRRSFRHLIPLVFAGVLSGACSDEEPARGQLMVALSTDMSIPKDVSRIRVEITTDSGRRYDFVYDIAPDGKFYLPGTVAIVAGETPSERVKIQVIGIRKTGDAAGLEARTLSKVVTTVPKARIATVPLPIQWLCAGTALSVEVPGSDPEYLSSCDNDADGRERACSAGECIPVDVKEEDLPDFVPPTVVQGGEGDLVAPIEDGACFDTVACFNAGQDVGVDANCSFATSDDGRDLNVGLRLPPESDGICDEDACYVPLNHSETSGWRDEIADGVRTIFLPKAVCAKLDAGEVTAVRLTAACPTKTEGRATCGPWTEQDAPSEPVEGPPVVIVDGGEGGASGDGGAAGEAGVGGEGGAGASGGSGNVDVGGLPGAGSSAGGNSGAAGSSTVGTGGTEVVGTGGTGITTGGTGVVNGGTGNGGTTTEVGGTGSTTAGSGTGATGATDTGATGGTNAGGTDTGGTDAGGGGNPGAGGVAAGGEGATPPVGGFGGVGGAAGSAGAGGSGPGVTDCVNGPLLFADPNLEARLRELIEVPNGPIMPQDVDGMTNLVAKGLGIVSLDGLECLNDLIVLDLSSNALTDISPLKFLPALSSLDLSANQVSDLAALSGAPNLTQLKILSNAIKNLAPLVNNQAIGAGDLVDVSGNPIDCELQGSNITTLEGRGVILGTDCSGGPTNCSTGPLTFADPGLEQAVRDAIAKPLGVLVPADVASLTLLDASGTGITSAEGIQCLTQLQSLFLAANAVTDLSPLSPLTNLISLELDSNGIVDVAPLATLAKLDELTLTGNQVVDVGPLMGLPQLSILDLTGNEIEDLRPLAHNQGLGDGDLLGLGQNPLNCSREYDSISQLSSRGVSVSTDCVYPVTDCEVGPLTFVDPVLESAVRIAISRSEGDIMPSDVSELFSLSAYREGGTAGSGVYSLEGLQCLQALGSLDLTNNSVENLAQLSALGNLGNLNLSSNFVSDLSPLSALSLYTLDLSDNQIFDLTPLATNEGIGEGANVSLYSNPFDCEGQSSNITLLRDRYVFVNSDCDIITEAR